MAPIIKMAPPPRRSHTVAPGPPTTSTLHLLVAQQMHRPPAPTPNGVLATRLRMPQLPRHSAMPRVPLIRGLPTATVGEVAQAHIPPSCGRRCSGALRVSCTSLNVSLCILTSVFGSTAPSHLFAINGPVYSRKLEIEFELVDVHEYELCALRRVAFRSRTLPPYTP